jgi:hypothetical protein
MAVVHDAVDVEVEEGNGRVGGAVVVRVAIITAVGRKIVEDGCLYCAKKVECW